MRSLRSILAVLLLVAASLRAAPPEPKQQPLALGPDPSAAINLLADQGVRPFLAYYGVFQGNPVGGESQEFAYSQLLLFGADLDFEKLLHLPGATFEISGAQAAGRNLSNNIGNINNVSEAYATPIILFYEMFWKQRLFDKKLELRVGRMTASDLFASVPAFGLQVSGGINNNPTSLFVNAPFTASPDATWGASAQYHFTDQWHAEAGVFQATSRLGLPAYHGLDFSIRPDDGVLLMSQVTWEPTFGQGRESAATPDGKKSVAGSQPGLPGTYVLGGYYSNWTFPALDGVGGEHSAYGFYAMAQQMVWRSTEDPSTSFSLWGGVTWSPQQDISLLPVMGFAGTIWQGVLPGRDLDQLLFTYLVSGFSRDYSDTIAADGGGHPSAEHVLELSYAVYLNDHYTIQPDLQYIIRPSGSSGVDNSLVLGFQIIANF